MAKNYGNLVSGYLDPSGRNFETTVFQAGKPVLDTELNLGADLAEGFSRALRGPSGWVAGDFLETSSSSAIVTVSAVANQLKLVNGLQADVNGWIFTISDTDADGFNVLGLGAGPAGAGTKRTDLVILEVWRRLLSPSPSAVGKSPAGRIWKNGNVKIAGADDLTKNYADDILDANVGSETTRRVQLQYRLRVISGVDLFAYPYGFEDPTVVANSVPTNAATPDGVATLFAYTNQSAAGDPGLWIAGDGNPANTLGTVDGLMYAIPLVGVFRRNTTAFNKNTNHNGGVASPGPSDRPDGLFSDIIATKDVADLRHAVRPGGWDLREIFEKNVNFLLDNQVATEWMTTPNGAGCNGHTVLWADEVGITNANGGNGTTTGDTPGASFIGEFDAARRTFSDRSIYEVITVAVAAPGGGWLNGSTFAIDPTALEIYPYAAFNWAAYNSAGVLFLDVLAVRFIGGVGEDTVNDGISSVAQITGLMADPIGSVDLTLGDISATDIDSQTVYVDILVAYPQGLGLSKTPTSTFGAAGVAVNNPAQLSAAAPIQYSALSGTNAIDAPHREILLQYNTTSISIDIAADTTTPQVVYLPERALSVSNVVVGAPIGGTVTLDASGRFFTFNDIADYPGLGDIVEFDYVAIRPVPQCDVQFTLYYETRAPQTSRSSLIGTTITLIPRLVGDAVYALSLGSGSQEECYPFPYAYVQMGGVYPTSAGSFNGEHELDGAGYLELAGFNVESGFLKLPGLIPFVPSPELLTLNRDLADTDIEGRSFFKSVPAGYLPSAFGQSFVNTMRHRNALPVLAEISADGLLGAKGQLVLLLLVRDAPFDNTNGVFFNNNLTLNRTSASVIRIKGHPLSRRF